MEQKRKIINDPVYGFITLDDALILKVLAHPFYQRLRRIHQMAMANMVYPGAVHTRLHHSLGAYHLMCQALSELKRKGIDITHEEELGAKAAILLHDVGHGPYSHALESILAKGLSHETISLRIMHYLNNQWNGELNMAISIFTGKYHKRFLHQLVSGQLDVDRMDYLNRDSFFTGVSEGAIGYDRIIKMLTVHNNELMVEEKAIYSIEKFLIARRLMYWQAYLHKTVLSGEQMLRQIISRAREIEAECQAPLSFFLHSFQNGDFDDNLLEKFCLLDDDDVIMAIKIWQQHPDEILSKLSYCLLNRVLYKIRLQSVSVTEDELQAKQAAVQQKYSIATQDLKYFVFTGFAHNTIYSKTDEQINIIFKDKTVKDISDVTNSIISQTMSSSIGKHYICWLE